LFAFVILFFGQWELAMRCLRSISQIFCFVIALVSVTPTAAAGRVVRLAPVTPWHVEWTQTSCTLARGFGAKDDQQVLRFELFGLGQPLQMVVAAKAIEHLQETDKPSILYISEDSVVQLEQKLPRALIGSMPGKLPTLFVPETALYDENPGLGRARDVNITAIAGLNRELHRVRG